MRNTTGSVRGIGYVTLWFVIWCCGLGNLTNNSEFGDGGAAEGSNSFTAELYGLQFSDAV